MLVGRRRRMLDYVRSIDVDRYREIIAEARPAPLSSIRRHSLAALAPFGESSSGIAIQQSRLIGSARALAWRRNRSGRRFGCQSPIP